MARILISPSKYVQGAGEIRQSDLPWQVWVMPLQLILRQEHVREVKLHPVQAEIQQVLPWHLQNFALIR